MSTRRAADSDAKRGASREKATSPRSTASCSRFSVGSSVLSSGSTSALIAHQPTLLRPHQNLSGFYWRAAKLDLIAARHAEHDVGDGLARLGDVPRRRIPAGTELAFDQTTSARGHGREHSIAEVRLRPPERHDDNIDRRAVEQQG